MHAEAGGGRGEAARRAALWHVTASPMKSGGATCGGAGPRGELLRAVSSLGMDVRDYRPFDALTLSSTCASYFTAKCEK